MDKYVWYACYGSNMLADRFKEYIDDCEDKTFPSESREYVFPHPIYFGGQSTRWDNCGTAFLDADVPGKALGRIYKITNNQFEQVMHLEGPKYRRRVDLEQIDGVPVVTFTNSNEQLQNAPSCAYYDTILRGMLETFPYFDESSLGWSLALTFISEQEYKVLEAIRNAPHGLSIAQVSVATGLGFDDTLSSVIKLVNIGLLRQDRSTLQYAVENANAKFYTIPEKREMIDRIKAFRKDVQFQNLYDYIGNPFEENESTVEEESYSIPDSDNEGRRILYYTTRYERSPRNRAEAVRIHGTKCQVCGFDFSEVYGEIGEGFIEVHHISPLSSKNAVVRIDPSTDLVCLCANCHRMIHKAPNGVYSVDELRSMIHNH